MELVKSPDRAAARMAGFCYLLTFVVVVTTNFGIYDQLRVPGDIAKTTQNIIQHPVLFRMGVVMDVIYCLGFVAMTVMLYEALKSTNHKLALLATFWQFIYAAIWIVVTIHVFEVFKLMDKSTTEDLPLLESSVRSFLSSRGDRYYGGLPFYALGASLFSYLMLKSGLVPRPLAMASLISCIWCVACAILHFAVPHFSQYVNLWLYDIAMALTQIVISGWLLVKK
jgi:hypothetical protein